MVFSLDQAWYELLFKFIVAICASGFGFYLIFQSYQNLGKRWLAIKDAFYKKSVKSLLAHLLGLSLNTLYIWVLIQVEVVFILGCFKIAPAVLIKYHFSLWCFIVLLLILSVTKIYGYKSMVIKQRME